MDGAGVVVALVACSVLTLVWLALGALVALAAHVPAVGDAVGAAADAGNAWAGGIVAAGELGEPAGQAVLDYLASAVNLVVAVVLWRRGGRTWTIRLLILAMIGSAGAFNLQAHAATLVGPARLRARDRRAAPGAAARRRQRGLRRRAAAVPGRAWRPCAAGSACWSRSRGSRCSSRAWAPRSSRTR